MDMRIVETIFAEDGYPSIFCASMIIALALENFLVANFN